MASNQTFDGSLRLRSQKTALPDVARDNVSQVRSTLDKVGMANIEASLRLHDAAGSGLLVPAKADAFVSLDDPEVKGIHMSRLFRALHDHLDREEFSVGMVDRLLHAFVATQPETSQSAFLRLAFDFPAQRRSLLSDHLAWRTYPVSVEGSLHAGRTTITINLGVTYSSTCPCSAALARQLIQERFRERFAGHRDPKWSDVHEWLGTEQAICATPHSQRSHANVRVVLADAERTPGLLALIDLLEEAVGTPVQTTVKREDEQEFARLNGENLMFAEDACRKLKEALEAAPEIADYRVRVDHLESLHPHDAVAVAVKGVPGGLQP